MKKKNSSLKIISALFATSGLGAAGYFAYIKVIPYVKKLSASSASKDSGEVSDLFANLKPTDVFETVKNLVEEKANLSSLLSTAPEEGAKLPDVNSQEQTEELKNNAPKPDEKNVPAPPPENNLQQVDVVDNDYVDVGELDDEGKKELEEVIKDENDFDLDQIIQKAANMLNNSSLFADNKNASKKVEFEQWKNTSLKTK